MDAKSRGVTLTCRISECVKPSPYTAYLLQGKMASWVTAQWLHQHILQGWSKVTSVVKVDMGCLQTSTLRRVGCLGSLQLRTANPQLTETRQQTTQSEECFIWKWKKKSGEDCVLHQCQCHKRQRQTMEMSQVTGGWGDVWHPLQYSCLGNSMDRKAWQAAVHGLRHDWARTHARTHTHTHDNEMWYVFSDWILRWQENVPLRAS